jgi:NADH-quinone oxidoreductase subunit E
MFIYTEQNTRRAEELLAQAPSRRAALLPLLWLVQEQEGWIPPEAIAHVARLASVTEAEVHELLSFYTLLRREPPGAEGESQGHEGVRIV